MVRGEERQRSCVAGTARENSAIIADGKRAPSVSLRYQNDASDRALTGRLAGNGLIMRRLASIANTRITLPRLGTTGRSRQINSAWTQLTIRSTCCKANACPFSRSATPLLRSAPSAC